MKNRSSYSQARPQQASKSGTLGAPCPERAQHRCAPTSLGAVLLFATVCVLIFGAPRARANGDAPAWMHALVNVPLPAHDEKTDAVKLYSEKTVTVLSADRIKT